MPVNEVFASGTKFDGLALIAHVLVTGFELGFDTCLIAGWSDCFSTLGAMLYLSVEGAMGTDWNATESLVMGVAKAMTSSATPAF